MKAEYDFSKGERGRFYNRDAVLSIPVYLDADVEQVMRQLAEQTGQDVEKLVNDWLRNSIYLIQSVQPTIQP
ncbi:MAG: hypothetical protein QM346_03375 [Chloroflexota bacterium]|jgi:hypothetical protein|nr:hypothetical protein [Chloroflexota bacterium]